MVSVCYVNNDRENSQNKSVAYFCIISSIVSFSIVSYESFSVTCNKSEACLYYLHILSACTHRIPAAIQRWGPCNISDGGSYDSHPLHLWNKEATIMPTTRFN